MGDDDKENPTAVGREDNQDATDIPLVDTRQNPHVEASKHRETSQSNY